MGGADIFVIPGAAVSVKVNNTLVKLTDKIMLPADTQQLVQQMYDFAHRDIKHLDQAGDDDFSFVFRLFGVFNRPV